MAEVIVSGAISPGQVLYRTRAVEVSWWWVLRHPSWWRALWRG